MKWFVYTFVVFMFIALALIPEERHARYVPGSGTESIELRLAGRTAQERANIKADIVATSRPNGTFRSNEYGLTIRIAGVTRIERGVEVLVRAWDAEGKPLGFGKDGTIETERIRVYNPPTRIAVGSRMEFDEFLKREVPRSVFQENPREALRQSIAHTVSVIGKSGADIVPGSVGNTTSTFYPDANPETSSVDGWTDRVVTNESWTTIRGGAGNSSSDSQANPAAPYVNTGNSTNTYDQVRRAIYVFDTSAIPDTDTVSASTLSLYYSGSLDNIDMNYVVTVGFTGSATAIANTDHILNAGAALASDTNLDGDSVTTGTYTDWVLNSTGIGEVDVAGVSKYTNQFGYDQSDTAPTWVNNVESYVLPQQAETSGSTQDPKLVVEHAAGGGGAPAFDDTIGNVIWWQ